MHRDRHNAWKLWRKLTLFLKQPNHKRTIFFMNYDALREIQNGIADIWHQKLALKTVASHV
jgi:hypothetical protein